jgi:haloalkane dehalogenase
MAQILTLSTPFRMVPPMKLPFHHSIPSLLGLVSTHPQYGDILRTPKERFTNLPGYPFASNYIDVDGSDGSSLYMHYIDEGPRDGRIVLLMHGNPAWSYLVRDHVKPLVDAGYRVIAPDLIGFGKSDKPASRQYQTYANQTLWVETFVDELGLCDATMFAQDWGGLIGLRVAMYQHERFAGVLISNAALSDGSIPEDPAFAELRAPQPYEASAGDVRFSPHARRGCAAAAS